MPDEAWQRAEGAFGEEGVAKLLMAIVAINAWNRMAVSTRIVPGVSGP